MTRIVTSCASVTGLSTAVNAATPTKRNTPPTHMTIAMIDLRFSFTWLSCEFRIDVITRAIAPSGCTTMIGAK